MRRFRAHLMPILCAAVAVDLTQGESILQQPNLSEPCASELRQPDRVAVGVLEFYGDLAGFNAAAGSPPVVIDFDGIAAGTDISGASFAGIVLNRRTVPLVSAPLIVVRGADTFTPAGFTGVVNAATNKLFPTSGVNVLSPGGLTLAPGPNPLVENDDLEILFDPPTAAFGFDLLFQELDCCSFTGMTVYDAAGNVLLFRASIPTGTVIPGPGQLFPGGAWFVGVASDVEIARVVIDELDGDSGFPDSNIGFDTLRVAPNCERPDICDGIDNDCDGTVDGGFDVGDPCSVGVGACESTGLTVCTADGSGVTCGADPGDPTAEVFDGVDNDCNGDTDEGLDDDGDGVPNFRDLCGGTDAGNVGVGPDGCPLGCEDDDDQGEDEGLSAIGGEQLGGLQRVVFEWCGDDSAAGGRAAYVRCVARECRALEARGRLGSGECDRWMAAAARRPSAAPAVMK